jgi:hypothetical protein
MKTGAQQFYALSLRSDGETDIVLQNNEIIHLTGRDLALFEEAERIWHEREPGYYYQCSVILYQIFAEIKKPYILH